MPIKLQPPHLITLPNGMRILHQQVRDTRLVHMALIANVGSRDELPDQMGMAHFVEHMMFKGTTHRRAYHILSRIDNVGGDLDAYTTREKTCLTVTLMREHLERGLELLHDMAFNSTFPEAEIAREQTVIVEEIDMYDDNPEERLMEQFDAQLFPHHELGTPILGTKQSLASYTREGLLDFYRTHYHPSNIVLSVVGNVRPERLEALAHKYMQPVTPALPRKPREAPLPPAHSQIVDIRPIQQAHYVLGGRAYALSHPLYLPWLLVNSHFGGSAMNSRLNLTVREKYGMSYNAYSYYNPYMDSGNWGVYAALDHGNIAKLRRVVQREIDSLLQAPLSPTRVAAIKKQFVGNLAIAWESGSARMIAMGKDLQDGRELLTLSQAITKVQEVTAEQMLQAARELMAPQGLSELVYLPEE